MASSPFPAVSLAADLSAAFEQALSQKGAGQRHAIQELWGNAMDCGDTAQLNALVRLHDRHPDSWKPDAKERLSCALSSPTSTAIEWCLSRSDFGWGVAQPSLSEKDRKVLASVLSESLYLPEDQGGASVPALLWVFRHDPGVLVGKEMGMLCDTAHLRDLLDACASTPGDLTLVIQSLSDVQPGPGQPFNVVDSWLLGRAKTDRPAQAAAFLRTLEDPALVQALSPHLPLKLPGFTQVPPAELGVFPRAIAELSAQNMEQAYGWSGGRAMKVAFARPETDRSAHAVCKDPERFMSWLARAAEVPAELPGLLSSSPALSEAFLSWRSGTNETALDILIVPRAFWKSVLGGGKALPWTRLERWLDRHAAPLFSIPSAAGSSFDDLLAGHFPEWNASRRRQALIEVASPRRAPGTTPKL